MFAGRYELQNNQGERAFLRLEFLGTSPDGTDQNGQFEIRASGDVFSSHQSGSGQHEWGKHILSWMIEGGQANLINNTLKLSGKAKRTNSNLDILVSVKITGKQAELNLQQNSASNSSSIYFGEWVAKECRVVTLKIQSQKFAKTKLPPEYTGTQRVFENDPELTLTKAFGDAGVELTIDPKIEIINSNDASWNVAEIHAAMSVPKPPHPIDWEMHGLLLSNFSRPPSDNNNVNLPLGVMFDTARIGYNAGTDGHPRQGFAVFRAHEKFDHLDSENSDVDVHARLAARRMVFTWMHEAAHIFNLPHAFLRKNASYPNGSSALTWTNYPDNYESPVSGGHDGRRGFWKNFEFNFDEHDLKHIRHGFWPEVAIGGSGDVFEENSAALEDYGQFEPDCALNPSWGIPPIEVLVRSQGIFEHLEPVHIEIRLRNLNDQCSCMVPDGAHELLHRIEIYVQQPSGKIRKHRVLYSLFSDLHHEVRLAPAYLKSKLPGSDRQSYRLDITYGGEGFMFEEPGNYRICAIYKTDQGGYAVSEKHLLRVCNPETHARDRFAWDYFTSEVGLVHALNGSRAENLNGGRDVLKTASHRFHTSNFGKKAGGTLALGYSNSFKDMSSGRLVDKEPKLDVARKYQLNMIEHLTSKLDENDKSNLIDYNYWSRNFLSLIHNMYGEKKFTKNIAKLLLFNMKKHHLKKPVIEDFLRWYARLLKF